MADLIAMSSLNRRPFGPRSPVSDGAQGVLVWYRRLAGREYRFSLVTAGWWGVGETGTVNVSTRIGWDWYPLRQFKIADVPAAVRRLESK